MYCRFEEFLKAKWPSEKRFGLEGCEVRMCLAVCMCAAVYLVLVCVHVGSDPCSEARDR